LIESRSNSKATTSPGHELLELTLVQANCVTKNVSGRLNLALSTRRFYGFFVAEEKHFL
jgi:hypothetical protein